MIPRIVQKRLNVVYLFGPENLIHSYEKFSEKRIGEEHFLHM
jgi:hypothetical protein